MEKGLNDLLLYFLPVDFDGSSMGILDTFQAASVAVTL